MGATTEPSNPYASPTADESVGHPSLFRRASCRALRGAGFESCKEFNLRALSFIMVFLKETR
jgi:hypothetical protein